MENIDSKENFDILKALTKEASQIDPNFKKNLRETTMLTFEPHKGFFSSFSNKQLNFVSLALVAFAGVIITFGFIFINIPKNETVQNVAAVPTVQAKEILSNIIKKNPDSLILKQVTKETSSSVTNSTLLTDPTSLASTANSLLVTPVAKDTKDFSYSKTTSIDTAGPKVDVCSARVSDKITSVFENYFDASGYAVSKFKSTDSNNNLISSLISERNSDQITNTIYQGGNYAARTVISTKPEEVPTSFPKETVPSPVSEPVALPETVIDKYFEQGSDNLSTASVNGHDFYVITKQNSLDCGTSTQTITTKTWINSDSFAISKIENFLGDASNENLINTIETNTQTLKATLDSIKDNFKFEFNVEIKNYKYDKDSYMNFIQQLYKDDEILVPVGDNFKVSGIEFNKDYLIYLQDRNFYPQGNLGDSLYSNAVSNVPLFILKLNYSNSNDSLEVKVYNSHVKKDLLFTKVPSQNNEIKVNEDLLKADLYSEPVSFSQSTNVLSIQKGNFQFAITSTSNLLTQQYKFVSINKLEELAGSI